MFILDTNVVSQLRKAPAGRADPNVKAWAEGIAVSALYVSAITILEVETGVMLVERRDQAQGKILRAWFERQVLPAFAGRILPVDEAVARRCALLHAPDRRPDRDALIAATGLAYGMIIVTRNVADFAPTGVRTLNPWTSA